ncbi:MAG TPA: glycosyltransferase family 9 protein [Actinomycetota bacterium]|nr:glycosyltransferase family 9 protein [Actinomycetota bacterium]
MRGAGAPDHAVRGAVLAVAGRPLALVYRTLGLGDLLTAVPALRAIRRGLPDHRATLATPRALHPLIPLIDDGIEPLAVPELGEVHDRVRRPNVAVNLHGRGPESHRRVLATGPRTFLAFRHPDVSESADGPAWRDDDHEVARWARLVASFGFPAEADDLALGPPAAASRWPGATALHPGAASEARRWPAARWARVVEGERDRGHQVVITGSAQERRLAERIAEGAGLHPRVVLAGRLRLDELASVVAHAGRLVCGDTGVAHLATAFGTPSVILFGPTSPARWGPPADRPHHIALWAGRTGDPHGPVTDPGLLEIGVGDVVSALDRLSDRTSSRRASSASRHTRWPRTA